MPRIVFPIAVANKIAQERQSIEMLGWTYVIEPVEEREDLAKVAVFDENKDRVDYVSQ
jgi:hypothetical protein